MHGAFQALPCLSASAAALSTRECKGPRCLAALPGCGERCAQLGEAGCANWCNAARCADPQCASCLIGLVGLCAPDPPPPPSPLRSPPPFGRPASPSWPRICATWCTRETCNRADCADCDARVGCFYGTKAIRCEAWCAHFTCESEECIDCPPDLTGCMGEPRPPVSPLFTPLPPEPSPPPPGPPPSPRPWGVPSPPPPPSPLVKTATATTTRHHQKPPSHRQAPLPELAAQNAHPSSGGHSSKVQ
eukprot:2285370-Prymnesium_polylepis.1